jgi:signal transduction histidine kinase
VVSRWLDSWRRNRLFRKYVVPFVAVVLLALLSNGLLEIYFAFQESKSALAQIQREKAASAALTIEGFVKDIERQMGWTTQPYLAVVGGLETRRLDYLRLQRQVPAITEVTYIDAQGREQLRLSRLAMEVIGSGLDLSTQPAFTETRGGRTWYGPVYFRKESEPYMALAVPHGAGGAVSAVEVNLKFIWDVVSQIRIGTVGHAYVVDAGGHLIAHPDISLVLKKTDLSALPQVSAARAAPAPVGGGWDEGMIATSLDGRQSLVAHTTIVPLGWIVLVEQPLIEAFAPLRGSIFRTAVLMLLGVLVSVAASLVLARKMSRPIQALHTGAARIGAGDLAHEIDVRTRDELEDLAGEFNRMTARLRESYATLEQRVEERTRELRETLDQQTATAEILKVISSSPTDVQPVLDAVAENATRVCDATDALILRVEDGRLRRVSHFGPVPLVLPITRPIDRDSVTGRAVLEGRTIQVADLTDPETVREYPGSAQAHQLVGIRTLLTVPLMREGVAIGAIAIRRPERKPFTDKQMALLQTFADQAVIAIENVRLFKELESRNAALTVSLDQQTATSEILRVISSSPTDIEPVMRAVVESAARLCEAQNAQIFRVEGEAMRLVARYGPVRSSLEAGEARAVTRGSVSGRTILERRMVHLPDLLAVADGEYPDIAPSIHREGIRTTIGVPLLREGTPIGSITAFRTEVRPFSDKQIALLQTFADQAVIAIENVRLFTELGAKNAALSESLEQQTATAEILSAISSSPTDVQPVFDAIVHSALRLLDGHSASVLRVVDDELHLAALTSTSPAADAALRASFPASRDGAPVAWHVVRTQEPYVVTDLEGDPHIRQTASLRGYRSMLCMPMVREGRTVGVLSVTRQAAGGFTGDEIALLQTFADQAVIAIENVRLFTELEARNAALAESLDQQTATSDILRVISGSLADVQPVFDAIARNATRLSDAMFSAVVHLEGGRFHLVSRDHVPTEVERLFPIEPRGLIGQMLETCAPVFSEDVTSDPRSQYPRLAAAMGYRSAVFVPMVREGTVIGAIIVGRRTVRAFSDKHIVLLQTFADQAVIAIENVRLFNEIQAKTRELEAANRHKDEFLASMSHELRTPLNAVIGFSEVLLEQMFGEINDKQQEYLSDILASGRHLLSLINDILDLAKIEAGRMELDLEDFDVAQAIDNAVVLVRERATRKGLALETALPPALGTVRGDQRKFKQVLLNLLSNAVKFTPEGGRVEVRAQRADGHVEVSVTDTGIGIAAGDQETVFEEFRQVGTDYAKKHEGTGLGLTLSRKFVELHGGRIGVTSRLGEGSTFTFSLPVGPWQAS